MKYLSILSTLLFVTYGQLIIKYEINKLKPISINSFKSLLDVFLKLITNFGILSGLFAAFIAALSWMAAMSKFELSSAYPYLSLNFILVPLLSVLLFGETINIVKGVGIGVIVIGVIIFSQG